MLEKDDPVITLGVRLAIASVKEAEEHLKAAAFQLRRTGDSDKFMSKINQLRRLRSKLEDEYLSQEGD